MLRHRMRRISSVEMSWDRLNEGSLEEVLAQIKGLMSLAPYQEKVACVNKSLLRVERAFGETSSL